MRKEILVTLFILILVSLLLSGGTYAQGPEPPDPPEAVKAIAVSDKKPSGMIRLTWPMTSCAQTDGELIWKPKWGGDRVVFDNTSSVWINAYWFGKKTDKERKCYLKMVKPGVEYEIKDVDTEEPGQARYFCAVSEEHVRNEIARQRDLLANKGCGNLHQFDVSIIPADYNFEDLP
ncbi:hypothetical protein ACFL0F_00550 [Patescibacteria group bacterium]